MGIRLASLRRQTNVVMAPACTYLNFEHDFSSESSLECFGCYPPIWLVILHTAGDNFTRYKQLQLMYVQIIRIFVIKLTFRHVVNRSEIFGCVVPWCPSSVVLVSSNLKTSKRSCTFHFASFHVSVKCSVTVVVDLHLVVCIMNNSDSMGDDKTAMGLQKIDMPTFEGRNLTTAVKEKRSPPAIDLLSNFEREMRRNGTNFEQDCEEFLKMMTSNAEKANAPVASAALTNGGSQLYPGDEGDESHELGRDLLHQVDNEMEVSHREEVPEVDHMSDLQLQSQSSSAETDVSSYADSIEEGRKKCLQMERRIDRLARRLKLQQAKVYGVHTSEQISGLLDFCRCKFTDLPPATKADPHSHGHRQHHNNSRTIPMDVYLKRLKRCSDQSCVPLNSEKFLNYFGSGTKESHKARNLSSSVVPKFDDDLHEHIEKISGQLHAQVKAITNDFDSDVTASSSGNDSLDEESPLTPETMEDRTKKIPL